MGRVKSLHKKNKGLIKNQVKHKLGYMLCFLYGPKGNKNKLVHRLVLEAFKPTKNKMQVNHKNLDKSDNRLINLEWVTAHENMSHAAKLGRLHTEGHKKNRIKFSQNQKGEKNMRSKLNEKKILEIRKETGVQWLIAKKYKITQTTVSAIKRGKIWAHVKEK